MTVTSPVMTSATGGQRLASAAAAAIVQVAQRLAAFDSVDLPARRSVNYARANRAERR